MCKTYFILTIKNNAKTIMVQASDFMISYIYIYRYIDKRW